MNAQNTALIILDGWGIGDGGKADAIANASTPVFDQLMKDYPHSQLKTYGEHVGLPDGQMGNSEVGHLNIGAGRIVYQDLLKINLAVANNELETNKTLVKAIKYAKQNHVSIHLMGLVSEGGVHSSQSHLHDLIDVIERNCENEIFIHAFTDGRDTAPKSASQNIATLYKHIKGKRSKLVSMIGRYYAMDRDKRWERIKTAYDLLVNGVGDKTENFQDKALSLYDDNITDEFFTPSIVSSGEGRIRPEDVVISFNFRTDRCRQITAALTQENFPEWNMRTLPLHYVTMTRYDESFKNVHVMFGKDNLKNTLGEVLSSVGKTQLRIAETEKYPHVTFFFSGGREMEFSEEQRIMVNSPKVATYDLKPEMSADEVTQRAVDYINSSNPNFVCLNFANPDMVGHTGVYEAIIKAVETTDSCLGKVIKAGLENDYAFIIIADHGNADIAFQKNGTPHTSHTTNPVPCIVVADIVSEVRDGILADVAPSILKLLGIAQPAEMTGRPLF